MGSSVGVAVGSSVGVAVGSVDAVGSAVAVDVEVVASVGTGSIDGSDVVVGAVAPAADPSALGARSSVSVGVITARSGVVPAVGVIGTVASAVGSRVRVGAITTGVVGARVGIVTLISAGGVIGGAGSAETVSVAVGSAQPTVAGSGVAIATLAARGSAVAPDGVPSSTGPGVTEPQVGSGVAVPSGSRIATGIPPAAEVAPGSIASVPTVPDAAVPSGTERDAARGGCGSDALPVKTTVAAIETLPATSVTVFGPPDWKDAGSGKAQAKVPAVLTTSRQRATRPDDPLSQ